jgi:hypothetical protein
MDSGAPPTKEEVTQGIDTRTDAQKDKQETSTKDVKPTPLTVPQGQSSCRLAAKVS